MNNPFNFEPVPLKSTANCGCQSRELDQDMEAFESEEEFRGGRRAPMRGGRLRSGLARRSLPSQKKSYRPPPGRPKPAWVRPLYRGRWLTGPVVEDPSLYHEPSGAEPEPAPGTEHTRWVQDCLNQALGLHIPVTGVMGPETRSAVRSFQRRQGIRASGIVGPDTEAALRDACKGEPSQVSMGEEFEDETVVGSNGEAEVAAAMRGAVAQLPAQQRPTYKSVGRLVDVTKHPAVSGPGLYLILWNAGGRQKAYHGKAVDLRQRLMQHHLCAKMLGLSVDHHRVLVAKSPDLPMNGPLTSAHKALLRKREKDINTHILNNHRDVFTNQRKELEIAVLGESWA